MRRHRGKTMVEIGIVDMAEVAGTTMADGEVEVEVASVAVVVVDLGAGEAEVAVVVASEVGGDCKELRMTDCFSRVVLELDGVWDALEVSLKTERSGPICWIAEGSGCTIPLS